MKRIRIGLSLASGTALAVASLLGCQKHAPVTAATAPPLKVAGPASAAVAPPAPARTEKDVDADVLTQDLASLNRKGYLGDAFFDFQKAELRDDARTELSRDAQWLRKYPTIQILLEGHCDDRGTEAYNFSLGELRANSTREYLVSLGIPESRIKIVSYGKERPFCTEDDERCWQENRRAHFLVTAK